MDCCATTKYLRVLFGRLCLWGLRWLLW